ncbi:diaminopimelate epimerase [Calycomorphotria hydatis]|uniref:Diaminopimelate epimerase n=1 Tax=Calycomorphotria hydatis TaxID=2528027 RepID=A0A517TDL8_9PLAN|nr:diaminopimelate epimerase [Calycomorphotria hydatis]QDT66468.1 Diaminopimelate epimerase [Calycomorphotria hydatis]
MQFTKMHGVGNEFLIWDGLATVCPANTDWSAIAKQICTHRNGLGSDGLITLGPAEGADAYMRLYNADGSEAATCGNGLRCVGKYLYDHNYLGRDDATVLTPSGERSISLQIEQGQVTAISVWMGAPIFDALRIPFAGAPKASCTRDPLLWELPASLKSKEIDGDATVLSMGNPHCVLFCNSLNDILVHSTGPDIETHTAFPDRTNVGFARVLSPEHIELRVWERGVGETAACGSGACAAVVAGILRGELYHDVTVGLPGGELHVSWINNHSQIRLTGPAVTLGRVEWNRSGYTLSEAA